MTGICNINEERISGIGTFSESHIDGIVFGGCLQCIIDQNADDVNDLGVGTGTFVMVIIDGDNEIFAGGCSLVKFTVQQTG